MDPTIGWLLSSDGKRLEFTKWLSGLELEGEFVLIKSSLEPSVQRKPMSHMSSPQGPSYLATMSPLARVPNTRVLSAENHSQHHDAQSMVSALSTLRVQGRT